MDISILEKDKVYKIKHTVSGFDRDYIICSPINDVDIVNMTTYAFSGKKYRQFRCHFVVCFNGSINIGNDNDDVVSGYFEDCVVLPLSTNDLVDVRLAIEKLGVKYNRKLNRLILNA
jgi:hypothetical protein